MSIGTSRSAATAVRGARGQRLLAAVGGVRITVCAAGIAARDLTAAVGASRRSIRRRTSVAAESTITDAVGQVHLTVGLIRVAVA